MYQKVASLGLLILFGYTFSGQNFISTDKQWNVRLTGWPGSLSTEIYKIGDDSIVNSMTYNKIWVSFDSLATWQYQGLLREESKTVYYIPPDRDEGILYDFNLEAGDTALVTNFFCSDIPIYVLDVDTVEYFDIPRKRWVLGENDNFQEFWVEGIGSLFGPLHTKFEYCIVCPVWELLCYSNNEQLEYIMDGETDCYQNTVGVEERNNTAMFSIRPNPVAKGNIVTLNTKVTPKSIGLYNATGNLVKYLSSTADNTIRIETTNLNSGLYFITVNTGDNRSATQKLLVE